MAKLNYGYDPELGIKKSILSAGKGELSEFQDRTKVTFHFVTRLCDEDHTVIDDSRKDGPPMELIMGKKFKLEVWEVCVKSMRIGEVASFVVDPMHLGAYPLVAKSLRDIRRGKNHSHQHHCCGMSMKEQGLGYEDLDKLMKEARPLEFILDVEKIEEPESYKKDNWTLSEEERLSLVPKLREEGNKLYKAKQLEEAAAKYGEAIGLLEQLILREKPGDDPAVELEKQKVPLLLNYSQCKLTLGDYYAVIEHTTEVLKNEPDNVKAFFRRGKAHIGAWNPKEAREDLQKVKELDPTLQKAVLKEIQCLEDKEKEKNEADRNLLQGKMFS